MSVFASCTTGQLSRVSHWSNFEFLNINKIINTNVPALPLALEFSVFIGNHTYEHLNFDTNCCFFLFGMSSLSQHGCDAFETPLREEKLIFWCGHATCINLVPHPRLLIWSQHSGSFADLSSSLLLTSVVHKKGLVFKSTQSMVFHANRMVPLLSFVAIVPRTVRYGISDGSWNFTLGSGKAAKTSEQVLYLNRIRQKVLYMAFLFPDMAVMSEKPQNSQS